MDRSEAAETTLEFALDEYPDTKITLLHALGSSEPLDLSVKPDPSGRISDEYGEGIEPVVESGQQPLKSLNTLKNTGSIGSVSAIEIGMGWVDRY